MTITPPEPAIEPAAARASKAQPDVELSGIRIGADEPPGMKHFSARPSGHAAAAALDEVAERGGHGQLVVARACCTWPESDMTRVPLDCSVPSARVVLARPSRRMYGMVASVSTLLSSVGFSKAPETAGNGGFAVGWPR